jgi:hypothetical protein
METLREVEREVAGKAFQSTSRWVNFKSYRRLCEALMSYIREKLFTIKSKAYFDFFSIWKLISQIKKKCRGATLHHFV